MHTQYSSTAKIGALLAGVMALSAFGGGAQPSTLTAAAPQAATASTRFAVVGDFGANNSTPAADVANLIRSWNVDFVATVGDNNYCTGNTDGFEEFDLCMGRYYHDFIAPYIGTYGAGADVNKFWPALGNHDWDAGIAGWYSYLSLPNNERYYELIQGPVHFFFIDSDTREPDGTSPASAQGVWLQARLAASTAPWKVVVFHHPPYSSSSTHGSSAWMQWPFQAWGATAVMNGHDHTYERIEQNGFPYFVNGLGGQSIYNFGTPVSGSLVRYNGDYGAMLVTADACQMSYQFITRTGAVIDSYAQTQVACATPTPTPGGPTATSTATPIPTLPVTLVNRGSPWKYLDNGSDQGTAWRGPAFDDSGWAAGVAPLGYDTAFVVPLSTTLSYGGNASNKYITTYFRRAFSVVDPAGISAASINLRRDDGAVVYVNGTEVARSNMPAGAIGYATLASVALGGADETTYFAIPIATGVFVAGSNLIAVEVHQANATSSDIAFDLDLVTTQTVAPTTATPSATPESPNPTATPTGSPTPEPSTSTPTPTNPPTPTNTSTSTSTQTPTATSTQTPTNTPTFTSTPTPTGTLAPINQVLVPAGATWRYRDNGSNQGTAWRAATFNDSAWKIGPAPLGFGDPMSTTINGGPVNNRYLTTYFRRSFAVSNPGMVLSLNLELRRDDGAVVYLNGVEIARSNMPTGSISYTSRASSDVTGSAETSFYLFTVPPARLVAGTNVLAVEVHQVDKRSADLGFDLRLTASVAP